MDQNPFENAELFQKLEVEYQTLFPVLENYSSELTHQIDKLLNDAGISLGFPIQARVKSLDAIVDKYNRLSLSNKSIKDIQDLVGIRIIILYSRDISSINDLISQRFKIIRKYNTQERLKEDQFGYSSIHIIIEIPEEWLAVPTLSDLGGLKAEIQIRTIAQHMWAEASHELQYKQENNVPPQVRRSIYRVSALLETVDLEFDRVLDQRDIYRRTAPLSGTGENLNVDLLEKILDTLLPPKNKENNENYSELLKELFYFDIKTSIVLEDLLKRHLSIILDREAKIIEELNRPDSGKKVQRMDTNKLQKGVYYTHVGIVRLAMRLEFGERYNIRIINLIHSTI